MKPSVYWLWLQHGLGAGSSKPTRILAHYSSAQSFYESGPEGWKLEGIFTMAELQRLAAYSLEQAEGLLEYCGKLNQRVISFDDDEYPEVLREIYNPPCALFIKGELPKQEEAPYIAIVGTRRATSSGVAAAHSFAYGLAYAGAVVVSGGALGIDTAAHKGALLAGGKTICVLGCGIEYNYLMSNASMREAVTVNGALISEYPPGTPPTAGGFPIRNRIISGLCDGTLVVEAASKSGSLITADLALEQGRDVFAVPGGIYSPVSQGVNKLIKDGAKPVTRAGEILEEYEQRYPALALRKSKTPCVVFEKPHELPVEQGLPVELDLQDTPALSPPEDASKCAQALYSALSYEPAHISEIAKKTGFSASALLPAVTELELSGHIKAYAGQRYSLV